MTTEYRVESNLKDGKLHGEYKRWHTNDLIMLECNFKDGKLHGGYRQYSNNGKTEYICNFKDGKLHGDFQQNSGDTSGMILKCNYKNGKLHGKYNKDFYFEYDNSYDLTCNFKDGKLDGIFTIKGDWGGSNIVLEAKIEDNKLIYYKRSNSVLYDSNKDGEISVDLLGNILPCYVKLPPLKMKCDSIADLLLQELNEYALYTFEPEENFCYELEFK